MKVPLRSINYKHYKWYIESEQIFRLRFVVNFGGIRETLLVTGLGRNNRIGRIISDTENSQGKTENHPVLLIRESQEKTIEKKYLKKPDTR